MACIYLISDTHFGHANLLTFRDKEGGYLRHFSSVEEMDEHMVEKWNSTIKPQDHVYHLGDVTMRPEHIQTVGRLNGHKRLVLGNHDQPYMKMYAGYFQKIFSSRRLDNLLLTHIPIHPESIGKAMANVHGHVHNNVPQGHYGPRYYNVSVEMLDYTPISLECLKVLIKKQQEQFEEEHAEYQD